MHVRVLTAADAPAFQALRLRALQEWPSAFASSHEEENATPMEVVVEQITAKGDRVVFGAFEEQQLIGVVGLQREQMHKLAHKAFIWGMYVEPRARKQGVGRQLLTHALSFAAAELRVRQVTSESTQRTLLPSPCTRALVLCSLVSSATSCSSTESCTMKCTWFAASHKPPSPYIERTSTSGHCPFVAAANVYR